MFIVRYPSAASFVEDLTYGFRPVQVPRENRHLLLLKTTKEAILTSRLNREIKLYLVPDDRRGLPHYLGIITAFFDDHAEPIVIWSPLRPGDEFTNGLLTTLRQEDFELYFFDELGREVMGVRAGIDDGARFERITSLAHFSDFERSEAGEILARMTEWFSRRRPEDDRSSFTLAFEDSLYPEDLVAIDAGDPLDFHGSGGRPSINSLEREEPGQFQERDILRLFQRAFPASNLYLNPFWPDTNDEIADVLCFDGRVLLVIQAKDSPNTERVLRRTLSRKRSVIRGHIEKAAGQLRGALSRISGLRSVVISTADGVHELPLGECILIGLVVVREMFDDDYRACSQPVIETWKRSGAPCVLLSYPSLHEITLHRDDPEGFLSVIYELLSAAQREGEYPKPRFLDPPRRSQG